MRVLCVGRHEFLSEHLCLYFRDLGVQCEPAVGLQSVAGVARSFEPHLVVVESELLSPGALEVWSRDRTLHDLPLLAVSLRHRPEECTPSEMSGLAWTVYLPSLDRSAALSLLEAARRPRGVDVPADAMMAAPRHRVAAH